jgi:integrase
MGKLTDVQCKKAKAEGKDAFLSDGSGLYLRVRPGDNTTKVWLWRFKSPVTGSLRWFDLGSYPVLSLAEARERVSALAARRREGIDPIEEKRQADDAAKAEAERLRKEAAAVAARMTVADLFERWERLELVRRKDKGKEARRSFARDVLPYIGDVAAGDVKRGMVAAVLDRVVERGSRVAARALLSHLKQMFLFASRREYIDADPTVLLRRDDVGRWNVRDRVLDEGEIRLLSEMLPISGLQESSQHAIWIMLSTCARVGEVSKAEWKDVDLESGTWRIPPENSKNGKEHKVFLSNFAREHFCALRNLAPVSPWVLPASWKDGHVCVKSIAKQVADRQRGEREPMKHRSQGTTALVLPHGKWTPHDLRRSAATGMGNLGIRGDVIEKCLNHIEQKKSARPYLHQKLEVEQREAWRLLGERLELLTGERSNVVVMTARAR